MTQYDLVIKKLRATGPKNDAAARRFIKDKPGEYGEDHKYLGIRTPVCRQFAKEYQELPLSDIKKLLESEYQEDRAIALMILCLQFQKGNENERGKIYKFYLNNTKYINNWDLVDLSAYKIVGKYLLERDKSVLFNLAKSENMWERRIAMVSTYAFIKKDILNPTFKIAETLLGDEHDLIHKAVGWMLREAGKKDLKKLENSLKQNYEKLPRTTLRYAIEKFEEKKRKKYLKGRF